MKPANGASGRSETVPTWTSRRSFVLGTAPVPSSRTTSQRFVGTQVRGRRPDRSCTQRESPSTARRSTRLPWICASRKSITETGS